MTKIFVSDPNRVEGDAVRQLEAVERFEGMNQVVGLPDLHPGLGIPLGMACMADSIIYPHLLGTDVGCGVGLWTTGLLQRKQKLDKLVKKIPTLDDPWDGDTLAKLNSGGLESQRPDGALGTLGGGNHFAELQAVDKILEKDRFEELGLDKKHLTLVVHSGSRYHGNDLFRAHASQFGAKGLAHDSTEGEQYIQKHNHCRKWAEINRALIAHRLLLALGSKGGPVLDLCHNSVEPKGQSCWLHRKGAAPADKGPIIIPGSRDALTYLVDPAGDQMENLFSLPHGAGRKWKRTECKKRLSKKYSAKSMTRTSLGGRVICEDRALLYEEAPQAYKNITMVVDDLLDHGLISR